MHNRACHVQGVSCPKIARDKATQRDKENKAARDIHNKHTALVSLAEGQPVISQASHGVGLRWRLWA
jgi:hypothetical protein